MNGRYVLRRDSDTAWSVSRDFGAGEVALDAVTFYSNALATNLAFVALGDADTFQYFNGTTWTVATGATMQARAFAVVGREFYRARDTNLLTKCDTDADPTVEANWGAANAFRIGDKASAITRMFVNAVGVLVIVKTDGIYSLATDGQDVRYFPFLRLRPRRGQRQGRRAPSSTTGTSPSARGCTSSPPTSASRRRGRSSRTAPTGWPGCAPPPCRATTTCTPTPG